MEDQILLIELYKLIEGWLPNDFKASVEYEGMLALIKSNNDQFRHQIQYLEQFKNFYDLYRGLKHD